MKNPSTPTSEPTDLLLGRISQQRARPPSHSIQQVLLAGHLHRSTSFGLPTTALARPPASQLGPYDHAATSLSTSVLCSCPAHPLCPHCPSPQALSGLDPPAISHCLRRQPSSLTWLDECLSNWHEPQSHVELKRECWTPLPVSQVGGGAGEFAFLTNSQEALVLLVQGTS